MLNLVWAMRFQQLLGLYLPQPQRRRVQPRKQLVEITMGLVDQTAIKRFLGRRGRLSPRQGLEDGLATEKAAAAP